MPNPALNTTSSPINSASNSASGLTEAQVRSQEQAYDVQRGNELPDEESYLGQYFSLQDSVDDNGDPDPDGEFTLKGSVGSKFFEEFGE